ncbi:MAG: ABC transporter permease [Kofleriaceae bacterium]
MQLLPIISTLRRHRTAATLIVLEIAFTCAIVCNAIFVIRHRLARMDRPSGVAEAEIVNVQLTGIGQRTDAGAVTEQDLVALRAIPGVKSVAVTNMIPLGGSSWNSGVSTNADDPEPSMNVATYMGSPDLLETLGAKLIAGRDFLPEEYVSIDDAESKKVSVASVIITKGVADRVFPGINPLGQKLYVWSAQPQVVVGVVDVLARPNDFSARNPKADPAYALMLPVNLSFNYGGHYLLRVDPARQAEVLGAVDATLNKVDPNRIILHRKTFTEIRHDYFRQDRAMAWLLVGVSIALLIITALGVVGLASFWVQQRTRQIGIRRALGATRGDILRYFQLENFILATLGIVIGMALAYAINLWLMDTYHVPRLPAELLPIGAVLLWGLGQIAVLGPAVRAAAIPPALATRSV